MATPRSTISSTTQDRILIWRSEVASAVDDTVSTVASSTGVTSSLSDSQSSVEQSLSQGPSGAIARGRRFWRRIARRLSGARFVDSRHDEDDDPPPPSRTAMYRALLPPGDAQDLPLEDSSDENPAPGKGRRREMRERLERAARLLDQHAPPAA